MKKNLFVLLVAILCLASCGGKVDENLSNLSAALEMPTAGGSRRLVASIDAHHALDEFGVVQRVESSAGCQTVNASTFMSFAIVLPKLILCMFGAMENGGIIDRPSGNSTYNYYTFDTSRITGRDTGSFKIRYGNDASGNLLVSTCQGDAASFEMGVANSGDDATITITGQNDLGEVDDAIFQFAVTAARGSDAYSFKSAVMQMGGRSSSGYFSVAKDGSTNTLTERYTDSRGTAILYSIFDSSQGASKVSLADRVAFTEAWENDSTFACVSPQSGGTYFSTVNDTDLESISSPSSVSFSDKWDCSGDFEEPNVVGKQDVAQDIVNCLGDFNDLGSLNSCGEAQSCT